MPSDDIQRAMRRELIEQLAEARRELRERERRLARLKYEWGIAKRLRTQASTEDEREKWRVQSDVNMALVMQQESVITEIKKSIDRCQKGLAELGNPLPGETKR